MRKQKIVLTISLIFISLIGLFISSCEIDKGVVKSAASIELVSGNNQTGQVLADLVKPVVVLVRDQSGNAFEGAVVRFTVAEGSVSPVPATTNGEGLAAVIWTLGSTIGTQTLNAAVENITGSPVEFMATATPTVLTDIDGNTYNVVAIGNQLWMAENLKVTHYPDNTPIPFIEDNATWGALGDNDTDDAYCYYDNSFANADIYGALYTYAAAVNGDTVGKGVQGVCPDGWHLPSGMEWFDLEFYIRNDGHFETAGTALKTTIGWEDDGNGTDDYGFSALPGGFRFPHDGYFNQLGYKGCWWSATADEDELSAVSMGLDYSANYVSRYTTLKGYGFSVRCIRD